MDARTIASELRLRDPDAFYARLLTFHDGLDLEASTRLNATIILLMANQIGDDALLQQILERAADLWRQEESQELDISP
ncbi:MAG: DUF2783 domain-containing protein [Gammaproteobacteria bacterium]|nr:DUF2783 domain-containing protein [Gammaproteobacteria bacterium]